MAEQLTPAQKMAVENRGGKLLVSAAAGSGKTKVLVDRLMSYLTDPVAPADINEFLIITYTKAAAAELRGKISEKLTKYIAQNPDNRHMQQQVQKLYLAKISTVHAFCADILREYAYRLDISADFRIAEENECQEMMYSVLDRLLADAYSNDLNDEAFCAFVDTQGLGRDDRQVPEIILQIYTSALCHLDPESWLDWCVDAARVDGLQDAGQTPWGKYLIKDLKDYLSLQIASLENCIAEASKVEGLEKPVTLLTSTVCDLKSLQACSSWDEIVNHPGIEYGTLTFKKEHKGTPLSERIKAIRNHCKDGLGKKLKAFTSNSNTVFAQLQQTALATSGLVTLVKEFRRRYDAVKRSRRVLDFSDIEQKTLDLLLGKGRTGFTSAAEEISRRFREIMVDEYQDSNEVQDAIFSALTQARNNCFMVGDVKQSIYQFRLADPGIFLEKYNTYTLADTARPGEGRKVMLSSNFRSSGGVISAVNDVFSTCMSKQVGGLQYGSDEMLYEGLSHVALPEPEVELYGVDVREDTYREEACFVASRIQTLLDGQHFVGDGESLRPITADDIVILLRSPGSVGGEFRYALEELGIPCTMGNDIDLLQTPQIDTLRAILQIIHNPLQDIPLIAALTSPVFGFSADDLARIRAGQRYTDFFHALQKDNSDKTIAFLSVLSQLRSEARFLTVSQLIHRIFLLTNMLGIYGAMDQGDNFVSDLQSFCQISAEFEATGRKDLLYFLDYLDAMQERGLAVSGGNTAGAVQIMSIHKSKGLEFPVVFLCGLSRMFNMSDSQRTVLCHRELGLGLTCVNAHQRVRFPSLAKRAISAKIATESISEELRVLYVAMTRARDRLIMTYAASKLADRFEDIVLRMDMSAADLLTANVHCPGTWVLLTALKRTEAGAFFQMGGYPDKVSVYTDPWLIQVVQAPEPTVSTSEEVSQTLPLGENEFLKIQQGLAFCYPYPEATVTPSKLTATQLKGRFKDLEAAENTDVSGNASYTFRKPSQLSSLNKGTDYGNALHTLMQYIDFSVCVEPEQIRKEIQRLCSRGLLSEEQSALIDVDSIRAFFTSEMGERIRTGKEVLREFKFSILDNASNYTQNLTEDQVLLQGVVDCALIEDDGIIIIDFKTDAVSTDTVEDRAHYYLPQVSTYAKAVVRIYERPVTAAYLYFFRIQKLIRVM